MPPPDPTSTPWDGRRPRRASGEQPRAPAPMIAGALTRKVLEAVEERGGDVRTVLHGAGLASTPSRTDRIPDALHLAVWSEALRVTGDPALPLRVAARTRVEDYGVLGLACKTARDLREALERTARYVRVVSDAVRCAVVDDGHLAVVSVRRTGDDERGRRAAVESLVGELFRTLEEITGAPIALSEVRFREAPLAEPLLYARFFRCPVRFGAAHDALVLDRESLHRPLPKADSGLSRFLLCQLEGLHTYEGWKARVALEIESHLPSGAPSLADVGKLLGVSARSLQRHLAAEGVTFQAVVDEIRLRTAEELLLEGRHSVAEIAFLLGFSEPSAFHRAFRRWTGTTPSAARNAC